MGELLPEIRESIAVVRGQRVLFSHDLAKLYGIETKVLLQAVRRNMERFPDDFAFQLNAEEAAVFLKSQFVTSNRSDEKRGGMRYAPWAFTEQGVAMLSSVLRSPQAVAVNIEIMRAFVRLRLMLQSNAELAKKLAVLKKKTDAQFKALFEAIYKIMDQQDAGKKKRIGFLP